MKIADIKYCWENNIPLVWNDSNPIKGTDYTITWIEDIVSDFDDYTPILIQYGNNSEAQVFSHEISKKKKQKQKT
ncbi:MAG TPA: hypothetical protein PKD00_01335 [Burkholderiales bacterium]|nr:hypothetical protein [Burkholderiales bacterium]